MKYNKALKIEIVNEINPEHLVKGWYAQVLSSAGYYQTIGSTKTEKGAIAKVVQYVKDADPSYGAENKQYRVFGFSLRG